MPGPASPLQMTRTAPRTGLNSLLTLQLVDAEPLYAEAESGFNLAGDKRNALFARVSRLRGEMQIRGLTQLVDEIDSILETDVGEGRQALQLRCLIVRGDVDLEIDAPRPETIGRRRSLWRPSSETGNGKSRAQGELGMIAFILGDTGTALSQVDPSPGSRQ